MRPVVLFVVAGALIATLAQRGDAAGLRTTQPFAGQVDTAGVSVQLGGTDGRTYVVTVLARQAQPFLGAVSTAVSITWRPLPRARQHRDHRRRAHRRLPPLPGRSVAPVLPAALVTQNRYPVCLHA
ncbi:MAG TPA: hypothetical protein VNE21_07000 [Mycobacteriales bacterium]|nr:hypothetical protein [Mycobacteriales bacterium]